MTTPPGYTGNAIDTEGVSGNTGAASSGTQNRASNAETSTSAGAAYNGIGIPNPDPNTAVSGTIDTSGAGTSANASFTPVSTAMTGTLETQTIGWPLTPGVTQAYRVPNTSVGYIDGSVGARDTTWTDRPLTDGTVRPDLMTTYTGTLESAMIGAPASPVGTGIPTTPSAPTVAAGPGNVTVTWSAVSDPSNAPVRGYVIMNSTGGTIYAGRSATSAVFDTVTPDMAYTFRIAAWNVNGLGPYSTASSSVTPYNGEENDPGKPGGVWASNSANPVYRPDGTVMAGTGLAGTPGAPTAPTLTQGATGVLNAAWTAPAGGKVVTYTVTLSTGQTKSVASGTTSTSFSGLTTGTATTLRITAVGTVGSTQSAASASVNVP